MKIFKKLTAATLAALALVSGGLLTACSDENEFSTQQYKGGVSLNVFGPCPVARGGELRFIGSGMNQITAISLPGSADVTDIKVVSNEEIRITVPQDAEEGVITLRHAGGSIVTKSEITYTEPILFDEMTPMSVKPGQTLTIKGDYLNLIHEVIFAEEVFVPEEDFISHTRQEISLAVPAEAQTGRVIISDGMEIPNWIYSEEELQVVLPSVEKVADLSKFKPGTVVVFTVKDIDLVQEVLMPNGDSVDFKVEGDKLTITLPSNISDGTIVMVPASGVKVAIATIGVALPEEVVADPGVNIWAGDVIKFKGVNMELVTAVSFPNVADAVTPESVAATEISVKVPDGTQSGNAVLYTASGGAVEVAISTIKPESVGYNPTPAALAAPLTVSGRNMQNVKSITFGGNTSVEISDPRADGFNVTVPATLSAGSNSVTLTLTNGEVVECPEIELTAPECAYATELPGEDVEINAGETFVVTIANADKLTGVQVNDTDVQYILNDTRLIVQVPKSAGKNSTFTLVSSNGEISYYITVIPATHVENVIFEEVRDLGSWAGEGDGGAFRLYKDSFQGVPAGSKLVFHVSSYAYTQIQVNDANWGQIAILQPDQSATLVEMELTQEILDRVLTTNDGWSETAMVIQGEGTVVSKVHIEWENSLETVIWQGEWHADGWQGNQDMLAWGAFDFSTVNPGSILRVYSTPDEGAGWYMLALHHGNGWAEIPGVPGQVDNPENGMIEQVLTADILADINANGGIVVIAANCTVTKITIE